MSESGRPEWKLHSYHFDGSCKPGGRSEGCYKSFSVGIFRIEQAKVVYRYKRGKGAIRIHGYKSQEKDVYSLAQKICSRLNDGQPITNWPKDFWVDSIHRIGENK